MALNDSGPRHGEMRLGEKIWQINLPLLVLITLIACAGFAMLYSAANGNWDPWASRQMMRFGVGMGLLVVLALTDIRFWYRWAYLIYFGVMALLVAVEVKGSIGMGAQALIDTTRKREIRSERPEVYRRA